MQWRKSGWLGSRRGYRTFEQVELEQIELAWKACGLCQVCTREEKEFRVCSFTTSRYHLAQEPIRGDWRVAAPTDTAMAGL